MMIRSDDFQSLLLCIVSLKKKVSCDTTYTTYMDDANSFLIMRHKCNYVLLTDTSLRLNH